MHDCWPVKRCEACPPADSAPLSSKKILNFVKLMILELTALMFPFSCGTNQLILADRYQQGSERPRVLLWAQARSPGPMPSP